jgi:hypothetical protein
VFSSAKWEGNSTTSQICEDELGNMLDGGDNWLAMEITAPPSQLLMLSSLGL